jgi:hypothetical protein
MTYPPGYESNFEPAPPPDTPDTRTNEPKAASLGEKSVPNANRTATGQTPALALDPDILGRFRVDLRRAGVAGEERLASLTYLALTSRVLPWGKASERPVSIIAKGTTSTGKSHTTQTVLRFFPPDAYIDQGSMSRRYLFYDETVYSHRFLIVPEWASVCDDPELVTLLRTLLSEGRIIHGTVEGDGKRRALRIEKPGPTGLIVTTTEGFVDAEMETRCLSLSTDDTPEQTRRVYGILADLEEGLGEPVEFEPWHELQAWIAAHGETRVLIPFTRALSETMPTGATRLRRDFVSLLSLVRAHAILFQAQRERNPGGGIIATVEGDYEPVRALIAALIAEGVEASVPDRTRTTVDVVRGLIDDGKTHPSTKTIADRLRCGRSATYDRIRDALRRGYLVNEANRNERRMKLALGAELPAAGEDFLPSATVIVRLMSGDASGQDSGLTMRDDEPSSGCPASPATPRLGDEMFPVLLADAARDGHITEVEFEERYALHKVVVAT